MSSMPFGFLIEKFFEHFKYTPHLKDQKTTCFIYGKEPPLSALREEMTMKVNKRLIGCATLLQDKQLLTNISNGDVLAQCIKYNPSCLAVVYTRGIP